MSGRLGENVDGAKSEGKGADKEQQKEGFHWEVDATNLILVIVQIKS
jgi:hypothetical protein